MTAPLSFKLYAFALLLALAPSARSSPYFESGFGIAQASGSSEYGFTGSFSFYAPVTSLKRFFHLDLGLQNRYTSAGDVTLISPSAALRLEISRFYVGGGYAPIPFGGTSGFSKLSQATYFAEAGLIWRVIPEFQITLNYAREYGAPTGVTNPNPISEYGFSFRFPISPKEVAGGKGVDFDGFRYPFGFMK